MLVSVDPSSPVPLAGQIAAGVRGALIRGELVPGERLPSARAVVAEAARLGVDPGDLIAGARA